MAALKDLEGKKIGRYQLVRHLETGGMAEIFLARHEGPGGFKKELVIKALQARYAEDPAVVAMFLEEARIGAELNHPGIVDVFDAGFDEGVHYIAMEHIPGKTLTEVIRRGIEVSKPLSRTDASYIIAQVADALGYLQHGLDAEGRPFEIVHRDVSPSNVVIGHGGQVKLIDFGIARQGKGVKEDAGTRPGKVAYMSPEQVQALPLDGRSDIFSLGIMLYEITLFRRLFRGKPEAVMRRIVNEKPPPPTFVARDYPPALELCVLRALARRTEDRYPSADAMFRELDAFLGSSGSRVGHRALAEYVAAIEDRGAEVSELGARRARAFMDDEGVFLDPNEEELDFDGAAHRGGAGTGASIAAALSAAGPLVPVGDTAAARRLTPMPPAASRAISATLVAASRRSPSAETAPELEKEHPQVARTVGAAGGRARMWVGILLVAAAAAALTRFLMEF